MKTILKETQTVNKALQSKTSNPLKILDDIYFLVKIVASKIYVKEKLLDIILSDEDCFEEFLLPNPYLGYEFENCLKSKRTEGAISLEDDLKIRNICIHFLKELLSELKCRLPKNVKILKNVSTFAIENSLKQIKEPITHILEEFKLSSEETDVIQNQ